MKIGVIGIGEMGELQPADGARRATVCVSRIRAAPTQEFGVIAIWSFSTEQVVKRPSNGINMKLLSKTKEQFMDTATKTNGRVTPWNKGKLLGQKPPLKLKDIWAIRIRLQLTHRARELALFNLGIDSKLRSCDLVGLNVHDVVQGRRVAARAIVMQKRPSGWSNLSSLSNRGTRSQPGWQRHI